jgi:hypothetical protein
VAEHSATDVAQHRPRVLGLRDDCAPHAAHARESGRCLAGPGPRRYWWLGASAISVVERIWTFSYFIPTIVRLTATEDLDEAEVQAALSQWLLLDYGRHDLTLAAWLAALKALSLPGERGS